MINSHFNSQGINVEVCISRTIDSALICELFFKDVLYPQALTLNPMRLPSPNSNKPSGEGNRMALGEKITRTLFKPREENLNNEADEQKIPIPHRVCGSKVSYHLL